jgi:methionyl-tRNA synthetase
MITQGPLGATDADFVPKQFHELYTAQLVNTYANCASRVHNLCLISSCI